MGKLGRLFSEFLTPTLVLILGGVVLYDHLAIREPAAVSPVVNGKILGQKFAGAVAGSFGDAWLLAADTLEQGKSVADAQVALQTGWQDGRTKAFTLLVTPEFSKVLLEGTEPATPAQRTEVIKLWRDFAAGLKGGK